MKHDFNRGPNDARKDSNGKACYGYMDYKKDTNFWSKCSVEFLTRQNKHCLKELTGTPPVTTGNGYQLFGKAKGELRFLTSTAYQLNIYH